MVEAASFLAMSSTVSGIRAGTPAGRETVRVGRAGKALASWEVSKDTEVVWPGMGFWSSLIFCAYVFLPPFCGDRFGTAGRCVVWRRLGRSFGVSSTGVGGVGVLLGEGVGEVAIVSPNLKTSDLPGTLSNTPRSHLSN